MCTHVTLRPTQPSKSLNKRPTSRHPTFYGMQTVRRLEMTDIQITERGYIVVTGKETKSCGRIEDFGLMVSGSQSSSQKKPRILLLPF